MRGVHRRLAERNVGEGPTRLSELAKNRCCVRSNVSYLVKHMVRVGLLKLFVDAEDRRVLYVHASQRGERALRKVLSDVAQLETDVRAAIGAESTDDLAERQLRVAQALDGT